MLRFSVIFKRKKKLTFRIVPLKCPIFSVETTMGNNLIKLVGPAVNVPPGPTVNAVLCAQKVKMFSRFHAFLFLPLFKDSFIKIVQ